MINTLFLNRTDRNTMNNHADHNHADHIDPNAPSGSSNPTDRINGHAEALMEAPDEIQNCNRIIPTRFTRPTQPASKTTLNPAPAINPGTHLAWAPLKLARG